MVSHKDKVVFIHINRTGGVSVETAFNKPLMDHKRPVDIIKIIGKEKWDDYFKFSFVRNPWDRLVSVYFNRKKWGVTANFNNWLKSVSKSDWLVQLDWISDDNQIIVDYVGRFETLSNSFIEVCNKIGTRISLPHLNRTHHLHYSHYYNSDSVNMVEHLCKKDIDAFGYKFIRILYL